MKAYFYSVICALFLLLPNSSYAQTQFGQFQSFEVLYSDLINNKIKITVGVPTTTVKYNVTVSRVIQSANPLVWKNVNLTLGLSTPGVSQVPFFITPLTTITNSTFPDNSGLLVDHQVTAEINNADVADGKKIYLGYRQPGSSNIISYGRSYDIQYVLGDPTIGTPPTFTVPVSGSIPIFEYASSSGRLFSTVYYSNYPGYTYEGIFGYVFESQVSGTVPLHCYRNKENLLDNRYSITAITHPDYEYIGEIGYVFDSHVPKTLPVCEYYKGTGIANYRYSVEPNSYDGYVNNDIKFYILQNPQQALQPLPDEDYAELYQYYHSNAIDHFYTTVKKDMGPWGYEKVLAYISRIPRPNMVPLYRYFHPGITDHYYTTTKQDYGGYRYEGVTGYVYPTAGYTGTVPIYSYWNGTYGNHYYNTVNGYFGSVYQNEGIKFYMLEYPY